MGSLLDNSKTNLSPSIQQQAERYFEEGDYEKAFSLYQNILKQNSSHLPALLGVGNILLLQDNLEAAKALFEHMLLIDPCCFPALGNLANIFVITHDFKRARQLYEFFAKQNPGDSLLEYNLALVYLALGDFQRGFEMYDRARQILFKKGKKQNFQKPEWDGKKPLAYKTLLIGCDLGLGDAFQFIRYAKLVKEQKGRVMVLAPASLLPILRLCPDIDKVVSYGYSILPVYDYHIPLGSLPRVFKTDLGTIPSSIPYLSADERLTAFWKNVLAKDTNFKIGLCWQGTVERKNKFTQHIAAKRSIPLSYYAKLKDLPGISFYRLQKFDSGDEGKSDFNIHDFGSDFDKGHGAFMDTAAIMKNLDLVITVDTSIAHLAGGLGVPVWVLLPYDADWRWLIDRNDSPWYPTMKLFRQKKLNDWDEVIQDLKSALKILAQSKQKEE